MSKHQCERWQMQQSASGGQHCAACGSEEEQKVIPEAAVEAAYAETPPDACRYIDQSDIRLILEAAYPHIHRTAWNEGFTAARAMQDFRDSL